jgi:hypothetical protein
MATPNQEAILGFLKQVDAGRWEETALAAEGGWLTGLIESVNRGPAPPPVPCRLDELATLRDGGYIMAGDAPNTFILSGAGEEV